MPAKKKIKVGLQLPKRGSNALQRDEELSSQLTEARPRSRSRSRSRTRSLSPPSQISVQPTAPPTCAAEIRKKKPVVLTDDQEVDLGDWLTMLYTKSMKEYKEITTKKKQRFYIKVKRDVETFTIF